MLSYTWLFKFKCDQALPLSTVYKYQTVIHLQAETLNLIHSYKYVTITEITFGYWPLLIHHII